MSYATSNLVAGETLLFETRHHWIVLLGPLLVSLLLGLPGLALLVGAVATKSAASLPAVVSDLASKIGAQGLAIAGAVLLVVALAIFAYGLAKRDATEMAVTNRRVLIKTGMAGRRTLDLMLSKVESIGVEETVLGRILGFGSVIVHGTGGTPEMFLNIARPQEFRRSVQQQIGVR